MQLCPNVKSANIPANILLIKTFQLLLIKNIRNSLTIETFGLYYDISIIWLNLTVINIFYQEYI